MFAIRASGTGGRFVRSVLDSRREVHMVETSRREVSNWPAVVAAMVYLAAFCATCYGLYSLATDRSFFDAFVVAFFSVFGIAALFYVSGLVREVSKRRRGELQDQAPLSAHMRSVELTHR
jgi:hypothetical protein